MQGVPPRGDDQGPEESSVAGAGAAATNQSGATTPRTRGDGTPSSSIRRRLAITGPWNSGALRGAIEGIVLGLVAIAIYLCL